jgi:GNAT superfamily N-acetyltransferase
MTDLVQADISDLPLVTASLARAFADDPVFIYLMGGSYDEHRATLAFQMLGRNILSHGLMLTNQDRSAAAFWGTPGNWKVPVKMVVKTLPVSLRAYKWGIFRALAVLGRMEKLHPTEPHYYLEVIGTDPVKQGKGHGAALMNAVLEKADAEGVGAYLESSKDTNVPYYRKFGFEVVGEIHHPNGPTMWRMWRDPR